MNCTICLDDEGEVVQKGCCCRGDAAAVHIACLVQLATHTTESTGGFNSWEWCPTCNEIYTGGARTAMADAWLARAEAREDELELFYAQGCQSRVLALSGQYTEAATLSEAVYEGKKRLLGEWSLGTVNEAIELSHAYGLLGRHAEAEAIQTRVLQHTREKHGDNALATVRVMRSLAGTLCSLGERLRPATAALTSASGVLAPRGS